MHGFARATALVTSLIFVPTLALAQSAPLPADDSRSEGADEILVTGLRASNERAVRIKRNSDQILDTISATEIANCRTLTPATL